MLGKIYNGIFDLPIILIVLHIPLIKWVEMEQDIALLEKPVFSLCIFRFLVWLVLQYAIMDILETVQIILFLVKSTGLTNRHSFS